MTNNELLTNLRDLERSYGNMRVHNVETIHAAIVEIEAYRDIIKRLISTDMDMVQWATLVRIGNALLTDDLEQN